MYKSKIIGCQFNSYPDKNTGEIVENYKVFVVSPIFDKKGLFCGYSWGIDYKNKKAYKSMPLTVSVEEFLSWGVTEFDLLNCDCDVFYNNYGNIAKVIPVISK